MRSCMIFEISLFFVTVPMVLTKTAILCSLYEMSEIDDAPNCAQQVILHEGSDCICNETNKNDQCDIETKVIQTLQEKISDLEQSNSKAQQRILELERNLITLETRLNSSNCDDLYKHKGITQNGVYVLAVREHLVEVYCEFQRDGHNWLLFQRRSSDKVNFFLFWNDYQRGFGQKNEDFWLGLDNLHDIVSSGSYMLRVDLEDWEGNTAYAEYSSFVIGDETSNYRLSIGGYKGTAGDALRHHNNRQFSTRDRDNDDYSYHCSTKYEGAWWYGHCHDSNLNGLYLQGGQLNDHGMVWDKWKGNQYSMKKSEMKIRPINN